MIDRAAAVKAAQRYVEKLQPYMRLAHWQIVVHDDPPDGDDCVADISCSPTRTMAALRISDYYITSSPEQAFLYAVGHPVWEHLHRRYEHEEELAVDEVARAIAPFLPLPPVEEGGEG